jgi:hypothetical protein
MSYKYDALELARIIGEPKDPRRPYPDLVAALCETDSADPNEYVYDFDVLLETDYIYTTVASGITQLNVSPDTPTLLTFVDLATQEYYVKLTDLMSAKERTLGRKKLTIDRSLNVEENYRVIALLDAAAIARGNLNDLRSGETAFNYQHLIDMIDQVIDYSENYVLVAGTQIDKDIKLWDWRDNKYHSMVEAFKDLGISVQRIAQTLTRDGSAAGILASTVCYLAGVTTEVGKPLLFVRKRINEIEKLGGIISESGDRAERAIFVTPNPVQVTSTRYLAVGLIGYEQVVAATHNSYAISKFTRTV